MLAVADGPPGAIVPVTSGGTSYRAKVAEPVVVFGGSTKLAYVTDEIFMLTRWPAVPLKVRRPFCPGTVVEIETGGPPGVIAPPASGGTSYSASVAEPVAAPCGSIVIE